MHSPAQHDSPVSQGGSQGDSMQAPPWQIWAGVQAWPQLPQFSLLELTSVHPLEQQCMGGSHLAAELQEQMPEMHMFPRGGQAMLHPPQWSRSVLVLTHSPSQHSRPASQTPDSPQGTLSPPSEMSDISVSCPSAGMRSG